MNLAIKNHLVTLSVLCSVLCSLLLFSNSYADAFKCVDKKGNTIFQDFECADNKKETKIEIKKYAGSSQCLFNCGATRTICIDDLGLGERNTSKGLLLCEKAKNACDTRCYNPIQGRELEALTEIERSTYERDLRRTQGLKDATQYKEIRESRIAQRDLKRKQRHCKRYEKNLAKVKAKWKRTQEQTRGWTSEEETYYRRRIENAEDEVTIECQ